MTDKAQIINYLKHLLNMAIADFNIDPKELELIYELGIEKGVSEEEINELLKTPDHSSLEAPDELKTKVELLYDLCLIIWADDKVQKEERQLLEKVIVQCRFKKENAEEISTYLLEKVKEKVSMDEILKEIEKNIQESKIS
jgi:uncharacterized tellurite resistance protein B-like protein